ncbi:hypothetical protein PL9631_680025 [Planktothrix paucivesiculata PCC 9631]|uniref:Uncharacterized protein n=1 Tax=Planktothrix paucivesiculata PCC 9631 TaxID=671071 RepID=A0A7Z9E317_9CYAN|nr:hypothetical protein PL9631_680025 [Planktothrix paucivesiculata PCC 9631]
MAFLLFFDRIASPILAYFILVAMFIMLKPDLTTKTPRHKEVLNTQIKYDILGLDGFN